MLCSHARVAVSLGIVSETRLLSFARGRNAFPNRARSLLRTFARHVAIFDRWHLNMEIDPVQQRSRYALPVALDLARAAAAFALQIAKVTARTRIHRRYQHELAWKRDAAGGTRHRNASILQRLAHHFEGRAVEFRQLIEKEHAIMSNAHFTRIRNRATSEQPDIANRVMRRTERTRRDEGLLRCQYSSVIVVFVPLNAFSPR